MVCIIKETIRKKQFLEESLVAKASAPLKAIWRRSRKTAATASQLVTKGILGTSLITPQEAYTVGLLHDAGVILLMRRFPQYTQSIKSIESGMTLKPKKEEAKFGLHHANASYLMAQFWRMGTDIQLAVRYHHRLKKAPLTPKAEELLLVLWLADQLLFGRSDEGTRALDLLGLTERVTPTVLKSLLAKIDTKNPDTDTL